MSQTAIAESAIPVERLGTRIQRIPRLAPRTTRLMGIAFLLNVTSASDVKAWCQLRTGEDESTLGICESEGEPIAWDNRCLSYSVDIGAGPSLDLPLFRRITAAAFDNWRSIPCQDGTPFPLAFQEDTPRDCNLDQHRGDAPNIHTVAFADPWPFDTSAFAVTTVWTDRNTGLVLDADILINADQGPYVECPIAGCQADENGITPSDLESILTHEVGHFLGLAHSQFRFATMHASAERGEVAKRSISSDDIQGVCAIYSGGRAPICEDTDFVPRGGLAEVCQPESGGCRATDNHSIPTISILCLILVVGRRPRPGSSRRR